VSARAALVAVAFVGLVGCGAPETPGAPSVGFAEINHQVFEPNCTFACHSGGEFAAGGLDMKTEPYATLVGKRAVAGACKSSSLVRVAPGEPQQSLVYLKVVAKLEDEPAPCGDGMPAGVDRHALTTDDVDAIASWIEGGALDD
jgi:hypothetical protein